MNKFKLGDKIVRTKNGHALAPIGYKSIVEIGAASKKLRFSDATGWLIGINNDDWELAEDTSNPGTVTHEGNVYEIGKDYLFSRDGINWTYDKFVGIDGGYSKPFCTLNMEWLYIKEVPASKNMGTITPAPIELIDGAAYMFNINGTWVGFYREGRNCFFTQLVNGNKIASVNECTNIRPMTVAESK